MKYIRYDKEAQIVTITMARPERLNAFGRELDSELADAVLQFKDDSDARVAILTGEGKAFCAGVDVKEYAELGRPPTLHLMTRNPLMKGELRKPVIAAINGPGSGAGSTRSPYTVTSG